MIRTIELAEEVQRSNIEKHVSNLKKQLKSRYDCGSGWAEGERYFEGNPFRYYMLEPWFPFSIDPHDDKLVLKCRQIIYSEQVINESLYYIRTHPYRSVLHTFHLMKAAAEFSKERYRKAIDDCKEFKAAEGSQNVHARSFELIPSIIQWLYIMGTRRTDTEGVAGSAALGKSPGLIIYDERQDQELEVRTYVGMALGFKIDAKTITGGTARTPANPLQMEYNLSDQKVCLYKCPKCGTWNRPEINLVGRQWQSENILPLKEPRPDEMGREQNYIMACGNPDCVHDMDHARGRYGNLDDGTIIEWVPQRFGENGKAYLDHYSGYHFNRFQVGLWGLDKTIKEISDPNRTLREIYNDILGLPFAGDDCPFPPEAIDGCKWPKMSFADARRLKYKFVVAGVDWGYAPGTYVYVEGILPDGRSVALGWTCIQGPELEHGELIAEWLKPYGVDYILADWGYKAGREASLIKHFGKRNVFLVEYVRKKDQSFEEIKKIDGKLARQEGIIKIDRNFAIEQLQQKLQDGLNYWIIPYKNPITVDPYTIMFSNIYRTDPEAKITTHLIEIGNSTYKYERSGPDHTAHCRVYTSLVQHPQLQHIFDRKIKVL